MPSLWSETLGARCCPFAQRSRVWGAQNLGPGQTAPVIRPHLDTHRHTEPWAHQLMHQSLHFNTSQGDSKAPKLERDRACSPPGGLTRGPLCRMLGAGGSRAPGVACLVPTHQAPQGQSDNSYQLWVLLRAVLVLGKSRAHTHYTCVPLHVCTHVYANTYTHIHVCARAFVQMCSCTCLCMYMHDIHAHTYACTHVYTHTDMHT